MAIVAWEPVPTCHQTEALPIDNLYTLIDDRRQMNSSEQGRKKNSTGSIFFLKIQQKRFSGCILGRPNNMSIIQKQKIITINNNSNKKKEDSKWSYP